MRKKTTSFALNENEQSSVKKLQKTRNCKKFQMTFYVLFPDKMRFGFLLLLFQIGLNHSQSKFKWFGFWKVPLLEWYLKIETLMIILSVTEG